MKTRTFTHAVGLLVLLMVSIVVLFVVYGFDTSVNDTGYNTADYTAELGSKLYMWMDGDFVRVDLDTHAVEVIRKDFDFEHISAYGDFVYLFQYSDNIYRYNTVTGELEAILKSDSHISHLCRIYEDRIFRWTFNIERGRHMSVLDMDGNELYWFKISDVQEMTCFFIIDGWIYYFDFQIEESDIHHMNRISISGEGNTPIIDMTCNYYFNFYCDDEGIFFLRRELASVVTESYEYFYKKYIFDTGEVVDLGIIRDEYDLVGFKKGYYYFYRHNKALCDIEIYRSKELDGEKELIFTLDLTSEFPGTTVFISDSQLLVRSREGDYLIDLASRSVSVLHHPDSGLLVDTDFSFVFQPQTSAYITSGVFAEMERTYYPPGIEYVSYIITNETENEVTYGEFFSIEKYENGEWKDAPSPSAFTFMGYGVHPYGSARVFVTIVEPEQYNEGIYRVCRSDLTVRGEKYGYYLEFAIVDEAEPQIPIRELFEQPYVKRDWEWIHPYDLMDSYWKEGFYLGGYLHNGGDALTVVRYSTKIYESGVIMHQKYDFVDMTTGERFPITDEFMTYNVDFLSPKGVFSAVTTDGVVYTAELSDDGVVTVTTAEPFPVDEYIKKTDPTYAYTSIGVVISTSQEAYRPSEMMVLLEFESLYTEETVESLVFSADYHFEKLTERGWELTGELGSGSIEHNLLSEGTNEFLVEFDALPKSGRYRICFTNVSFELIETTNQPEPREYAIPPEEYDFCLEFDLERPF